MFLRPAAHHIADALTGERYDRETLSRTSYVAWIEPFALMAALAPVTRNIGLVCTSTTTYDEPYNIARNFASLDLISGGRSGWNAVTSAYDAEASNFGREVYLPKVERYETAGVVFCAAMRRDERDEARQRGREILDAPKDVRDRVKAALEPKSGQTTDKAGAGAGKK